MTPSKIYQYVFLFSMVAITGMIATKSKAAFKPYDEYELIKKYLLNDSPLYGFNKPKIWIHNKYEINARKWASYLSRNSTDLNQPYLHLTIQTIINHCGNDFNICLIDDKTFSNLIPSWDIDLSTLSEPMRHQMREIGMLELVYYYGGMVVPNSFVCTKNLLPFYNEHTENKNPFICEKQSRSVNTFSHPEPLLFLPNLFFFGADKHSDCVKEYIEYLKSKYKSGHFSLQRDLTGDTSDWALNAIQQQKMNLVSGEWIGTRTANRAIVGLEELISETPIPLSPTAVGVYIPSDELLVRHKYQWFAGMSEEEILQSEINVSKYIQSSFVDSSSIYGQNYSNKDKRSVVAL